MNNDFHILIPARLDSSRLPRKALLETDGLPLVVHTLRRAEECGARSVNVATDSAEIADAIVAAGGQAVMTSRDHQSGTDRLAEAVSSLKLEPGSIVVNLQGDEPGMPAACIRQVAKLLRDDPGADMATLSVPIRDELQWRDPNVVKLVCDERCRALYFSRAPIPHPRDDRWPNQLALRHVGLYAYRIEALLAWQDLAPSPLERTESLEQLRALQAGWTITVATAVESIPVGIDTPEDLDRFRKSK